MVENSANVEGRDAPVPSSSSKPDIWLVNDDPAQLLVQKRLLGRFAASVTEFASPVEAVAAARAGGSARFLVTDFNMPVMKGPQLAAYWCALHPDAKVLILSASEIPADDRTVMDSLSPDAVKLMGSYRIAELAGEAAEWFSEQAPVAAEPPAAAAKEPAAESRLEPSVLDKLQELGGWPFVEKVLTRFVEELPGRMETIEQSHSSGDLELLHRTAHSLKGSCGLIGAVKLAKVAGELESASEGEPEQDLAPQIADLRAEFSLTLEEVEGRLAQ